MSHELRTPLNSLLLLSQQLRDNPDGNLSDRQVEYARTIFASGNDLLTLINDILDLSKIESGTVTVDAAPVAFRDLKNALALTFQPVAEAKKLALNLDFDPRLPGALQTDEKRLLQILKNLLSNAFKFTERGEVKVRVASASGGWSYDHPVLSRTEHVVAFSVIDTGIGIAPDKQQVIFEAFQQADGTTSRKYGGTGLGLAISRELARILGGEIRLESVPDLGSTFTVYLPLTFTPVSGPSNFAPGVGPRPSSTVFNDYRSSGHNPHPQESGVSPTQEATPFPSPSVDDAPRVARREEMYSARRDEHYESEQGAPAVEAELLDPVLADDRNEISAGDRTLLIVEDDPAFAAVLLDLARERGFKGLVAARGDQALALAQRYRPSALTLDLHLPDISGWSVLDRLKHDPTTRHIPVHIISSDEEALLGRKLGALDFLTKSPDKAALERAFGKLEDFLARRVKNLLVVEDDEAQRERIVDLIGNGDVKTTAVTTGKQALAVLKEQPFDCLVLDLKLPDMTGFELIHKMQKDPSLKTLPVIVYTAQELTRQQETQLRKVAKSIIVKDVRSPERLLDEVTLFLHRVEADLPQAARALLENVRKNDPLLAGKRVLVVDDDIRNIFALTAVLERHSMQVFTAENGKDAISLLDSTPDIDIVLMDVMMPELDGYETTRLIRGNPKYKNLPIISLTAKAMLGDREKSIESGASDYISKPVNTEKLLSLLRVWLYRS